MWLQSYKNLDVNREENDLFLNIVPEANYLISSTRHIGSVWYHRLERMPTCVNFQLLPPLQMIYAYTIKYGQIYISSYNGHGPIRNII